MENLDRAREIIDGECDCSTPEYRALDHLEKALRELVERYGRHIHSGAHDNA